MLKREALAKLYATKQGKYRWNAWPGSVYVYYNTAVDLICWSDGNIYSSCNCVLYEDGWEEYKEPVVAVGLEALFKKHKELGKKETYWTCSEYKSVFRARSTTNDKNSNIELFWPSGAHVVVDHTSVCATYTMVEQ